MDSQPLDCEGRPIFFLFLFFPFLSIFLKFLPEIIDETRISIISISLQHYPGGLLSAARAGNEIKSIKIGKEEINLSLFMENMIAYVENPQESTDKP